MKPEGLFSQHLHPDLLRWVVAAQLPGTHDHCGLGRKTTNTKGISCVDLQYSSSNLSSISRTSDSYLGSNDVSRCSRRNFYCRKYLDRVMPDTSRHYSGRPKGPPPRRCAKRSLSEIRSRDGQKNHRRRSP